MAIIQRYSNIPQADGTLRHAPFMPVLIRNAYGKLIEVIGLLDSGADCTVMPRDLADLLGMTEESKTHMTRGIGGIVPVKKIKFQCEIRGKHEKHTMHIPALVLQEKADIPLLLGRSGFFDNFHITFKQDRKKIILKKVDSGKIY